MSKLRGLEKIWYEEFLSKDSNGGQHCGLCGNYGILKRDNVKTPAGSLLTPIKAYCICPNGRVMKRKKCAI